jgi:hypothetical protein
MKERQKGKKKGCKERKISSWFTVNKSEAKRRM